MHINFCTVLFKILPIPKKLNYHNIVAIGYGDMHAILVR